MIGNDFVFDAAFDDVIRHVRPRAVYELLHNASAAAEFCDGVELSVVQETLDQGAIYFLPDSAILTVVQVGNIHAVGKFNAGEIAKRIPRVAGGTRGIGLSQQFTVGILNFSC